MILTLELRGNNKRVIAEMMHMSYIQVVNITNRPEYVAAREARLRSYDNEFMNLKGKVVDAVSDALDVNSDMKDRLKAAELWFRAQGYGGYAKDPEPPTRVTAEDVVARLLGLGVQMTAPPPEEPANVIEVDFTEADAAE